MSQHKKPIFVFGSNLGGYHGAGAAKYAADNLGAVYGRGQGPQGQSYAIPTKDKRIRTLELSVVQKYVEEFLEYAKAHPTQAFQLTPIGCGLAGYRTWQIAPMFKDAPRNVWLPPEFLEVLHEMEQENEPPRPEKD